MKFYKQRNAGEIIGDSLIFFRAHLMEFGKIILPILMLSMAISLTEIYFVFDSVSALDGNGGQNSIIRIFDAIVTFLLGIGIYGYMKAKTEGRTPNSYKEIWQENKSIGGRYFGASFLIGLMIVAGLIVLIIPGIYLAVASSTALCFVVFEKKGAGDSISASFKLLKGKWWDTFAVMIVFIFIAMTLTVLAGVPLLFTGLTDVFLGKTFLVNENNFIYFALSTIISVITTFIYYFLISIATCFVYFSNKEAVEGTGEAEEIEKFGAED